MVNFRFVLSCIVASAVMLGVSWFWHGVFLNDLSKLKYSVNIFYVFAPIAYVIIGFVVVTVHRLDRMRFISGNVLMQGFLSGVVCGFFIYIISIVVGISFVSSITWKNVMIDLPWQMFEQGLGGLAVSFVYVFVRDSSYE